MSTLMVAVQLIEMTCGNCGISFAMPQQKYDECYRDHNQSWYCPNGHGRHFIGKTAAQKEKERADSLAQDLERARIRERRAHDEVTAQMRQNAALRGVITRQKNKIAKGVCPVPGCRRNFGDHIIRHIAGEHPQWAAEHEEVLAGDRG